MSSKVHGRFTRRSLFVNGAVALGGAIGILPLKQLSSASAAEDSQTESPDKVPLRIIVVASLSEMQEVQERLKKGEDFASLAMERSLDPTYSDGGYLGQLDPAGLRPELRDALKGVGPGQISAVVKIPEGYAIVKVEPQVPDKVADHSPNGLLALTGPGAVRYGPEISGWPEVFGIFTMTRKPEGWNRNVLGLADLYHQTVSAAIKQAQKIIDPTNPDKPTTEIAFQMRYLLAQLHCFQGEMDGAVEEWTKCYQLAPDYDPTMAHYLDEVLGIAYLHKSEMENDIYVAPGDRCLFPMPPGMKYSKTEDSEKAAEHLLSYLGQSGDDLEAKWLLALTSMTLGKYPAGVPDSYRIPLTGFNSTESIGRFIDVAPEAGLDIVTMSGGVIADDFENRGVFDIFLSESGHQQSPKLLHYFHNNGDGTFTEQSERAGLLGMPGGLNVIQGDYNNDGCLDVLVLRGGWEYPQPMSLLRGNGDGTFAEVTRDAGLTALMATQTAVWADINNDGLLDLFVGSEIGSSRLFLNNGDGTFQDISNSSGVDRIAFTKGVVAGDFDNDGYVDFYVSNLGGSNFLYHNEHNNTFKDVAREAGVRDTQGWSFASWFFDYDNDGWLDLFSTCFYSGSVDETLRTYLNLPHNATTIKLYKNLRDGTFEDVTKEVSLDKVYMPMGANFGDVDNDGFLDIYLGTGNPSYGSLVPNVLLRNEGGRRFVDITGSSGTGDLHKGHGVAFADMSNSGQQDLLAVIGGAVPGDRHVFRLFKNPGNTNDWIRIKLVGVKSNRSAIGARIAVTVENEGSGSRSIHRTVGSGASFGACPFEQHFGLGRAAKIESIEIWWPASNTRQTFFNVSPNQVIAIKELATQWEKLDRPVIPLGKQGQGRS